MLFVVNCGDRGTMNVFEQFAEESRSRRPQRALASPVTGNSVKVGAGSGALERPQSVEELLALESEPNPMFSLRRLEWNVLAASMASRGQRSSQVISKVRLNLQILPIVYRLSSRYAQLY